MVSCVVEMVYQKVESSGYHWTRGCLGHRARLDTPMKRNICTHAIFVVIYLVA
jgi:hypothetical protein